MPLDYKRTLSDEDIKALEDHVPNALEWLDTAISEKIASCKKRIIRKEIETALDNNLPIPSSASDVLAQVFDRPDYKSRAQRDEDAVEKPRVDLPPVVVPPVVEPPVAAVPVSDVADGKST